MEDNEFLNKLNLKLQLDLKLRQRYHFFRTLQRFGVISPSIELHSTLMLYRYIKPEDRKTYVDIMFKSKR